jgi:hypothetical protein
MWSRKNKVWFEFRKDIIAADKTEGLFLADYLRHVAASRSYIQALEVADLQRYKVLKQPGKVKSALGTRYDVPFIFIIGKN